MTTKAQHIIGTQNATTTEVTHTSGQSKQANRQTKERSKHPSMKNSREREADIIIVGAGMSGLVAAKKLQERLIGTPTSSSATVMVLEARDRLGGRIHTVDQEKMGTIDMGAAWIHGHSKKNPISQLYKQMKDQQGSTTNKKKNGLFNTNWGNIMVYNTDVAASEQGQTQAIPCRQVFRAYKQHAKLIEKVQALLEEESADMSLYQAIQKVQPSALQDPLLNLIFAMEEEGEFGGPLDDLSTWWFDEDGEFPGQDALVTTSGGFQSFIDFVAAGVDVRTDVQVESIQYTSSRTRAESSDPNNATSLRIETTNQGTFKAKYCIVTVPLGVLKANTIQFQPALPLSKQKAIQSVGFGTIAKVVLVFGTVFWPLATQIFANISKSRTSNQERGKFPYLLNMHPATGKPVLVAFAGGEYVKNEMQNLDDNAIVQQVMEIVRSMFGKELTTEPIESHITRWGTDPYSRGAYSYHATGQKNHAWHDLAESVDGVLYFAGEHCSKKYRGTVHGAYLSGERAADEVYKQIKKQIYDAS